MVRRRVFLGVAAVVVLAGAWLAYEYFEVHKLFVDDEVDEAAPTFATTIPDGTSGSTSPTAAPAEIAGTFTSRSHPTSGRAVVLADGAGRRVLRFEDFKTDNGPDLNVYLSSAAPDAPAGQLNDDIIDLGDLKGNVGAQNYEIPAGVDLARHKTVVVWCVRFTVAFGVAELAAA